MRRSARLRQREVWRQKQTSNSKQRHHTALAIIAGYHTSKMQQTHRESAAAIASKSGRRELEAEGHQKRASAGANSKTKLAMAVGRLAYPEALGPNTHVVAHFRTSQQAAAVCPSCFLRVASAHEKLLQGCCSRTTSVRGAGDNAS